MTRAHLLHITFAIVTALAASTAHGACNFDIDRDGALNPATDGVLIVRRLLGLAVRRWSPMPSTRPGCAPAPMQIESHRQHDCRSQPASGWRVATRPRRCSDGLMLVRAMVGVTGTWRDHHGDCRHPPRNTWTLIRQHLNGTCGGAFANNATGPAWSPVAGDAQQPVGHGISARRPHAVHPARRQHGHRRC